MLKKLSTNWHRYSYWFIGLISTCYYFFLITDFNFNLFSGSDFFNFGYNFYFLSLIDGRLDVPTSAIGYEGFYDKDGRAYVCYGILPAILRTFFHPFVDLSITPVSRFVVLFFVILTSLLAQSTAVYCAKISGHYHQTPTKFIMVVITGMIWLGSPMMLLAARASIYHEPIALALLFTVAYIRIAIPSVFSSNIRFGSMIALSVIAGLTVHARPSVAVGLYVGIGFISVWVIASRAVKYLRARRNLEQAHKLKRSFFYGVGAFTLVGLILLLFGGLFLELNFLKFGNPLITGAGGSATGEIIYGTVFLGEEDPNSVRMQAFEKYGTFNVKRILPNLMYYSLALPDLMYYRLAKYVDIFGSGTDIGILYSFMEAGYVRKEAPREPIVLLWLSWCALFLIGVILLFSRIKIKQFASIIPSPILGILVLSSTLTSGLLILSYGTITMRYKAEIWPFLWTVTILTGPYMISYLFRFSVKKRKYIIVSFAILAILSVAYSLRVSIKYHALLLG